jgi:hypothetical protein
MRLPGGCNYVLTQKETEDVISAVMRSDELVQATSVSGLKLLVYEALRRQRLVYEALRRQRT